MLLWTRSVAINGCQDPFPSRAASKKLLPPHRDHLQYSALGRAHTLCHETRLSNFGSHNARGGLSTPARLPPAISLRILSPKRGCEALLVPNIFMWCLKNQDLSQPWQHDNVIKIDDITTYFMTRVMNTPRSTYDRLMARLPCSWQRPDINIMA